MKSKLVSSSVKRNKSSAPRSPDPKPSSSNFIREFRNKKVSNNLTTQPLPKIRESLKATDSRVVHPFAKYNASGQLQCVLCAMPLPSGKAWSIHTQSRKHKDNMEILRKTATKSTKTSVKLSPSATGSPLLGVESREAAAPPAKKLKSILKNSHTLASPPPAPAKEDQPTPEQPLSGEQTQSSTAPVNNTPLPTPQEDLPNDLFDQAPAPVEEAGKPAQSREGEDKELPEGFFDDPKVDAKKRGVKPQDPMEREWENFQRVLETENEQSELMVARQDAQNQLGRDFSETHQQNGFYYRAEELRRKQESLTIPDPGPDSKERGQGSRGEEGAEPSQDSDSGSDFGLDFDWRSQSNKIKFIK